jgi:hypothetical protein
MDKIERIILKGIIKGLTAQGHKSRRLMQQTSGDTRSGHRYVKNVIGQRTRLYLLAYAFLRGKKFREIEPRTDWKSKYLLSQVSSQLILVVNQYTDYEAGKKNAVTNGRYRAVKNEDEIIEWLTAEPRAEKQPLKPRVPYSRQATDGRPERQPQKIGRHLTKVATA